MCIESRPVALSQTDSDRGKYLSEKYKPFLPPLRTLPNSKVKISSQNPESNVLTVKIIKGSVFSKTLGNKIYLTHHWPKNLTKILILYLIG